MESAQGDSSSNRFGCGWIVMEFWPRPKIAAMVPPRVPTGARKAWSIRPQRGRICRRHRAGSSGCIARMSRSCAMRGRSRPMRLPQNAASTEWSSFELIESVTGTRQHDISPARQRLLRVFFVFLQTIAKIEDSKNADETRTLWNNQVFIYTVFPKTPISITPTGWLLDNG